MHFASFRAFLLQVHYSLYHSLNYYHPIALTPIVIRCFQRIVIANIEETILDAVVPLQFEYHQNQSMEDSASHWQPRGQWHLTHGRMLLIDYSSAFNMVMPHKVSKKQLIFELTPTICNWELKFPRVGIHTFWIRTLSTGKPRTVCWAACCTQVHWTVIGSVVGTKLCTGWKWQIWWPDNKKTIFPLLKTRPRKWLLTQGGST